MADMASPTTEKTQKLRSFTLKEVEEHNEKKSVWILIHYGVYDLTKFLEEVS